MAENAGDKTVAAVKLVNNNTPEIPQPCQFSIINLKDDKRIRDEQMEWLPKEDENLPIWSRRTTANCSGRMRELDINKKKNYDIEIPSRLWSLWGAAHHVATISKRMSGIFNYEPVSCILALCSALKYNLNEWTSHLLTSITVEGSLIYPELLKRLNVHNSHFQMNHLNSSYQFDNTLFQVTLEQVATGFVYIPYGFNEYNIARALTYFFNNYQFGLIHCNSKVLAIGFCVDIDDGYFMFDCQSKGGPVFNNNETNAYILRCGHLQVLLYCVIMTLNATRQNINFTIYNVDVNINDNPEHAKKTHPLKAPPKRTPISRRGQQKYTTSQQLQEKREALKLPVTEISLKNYQRESGKVTEKSSNSSTDREENMEPTQRSQFDMKTARNLSPAQKRENKEEHKQMSAQEKETNKLKRLPLPKPPLKVLKQKQNTVDKENSNKTTTNHVELPRSSTTASPPPPPPLPPKPLFDKDGKISLVKNNAKAQTTSQKKPNPKIFVVNQLSDLMYK